MSGSRRVAAVAASLFLVAALLTSVGEVCASPISARELVEVRDLSSLTVSPNGRWAVVRVSHSSITLERTVIEWWVVELDAEGPSRRLAEGGAPIWNVNGGLANEFAVWSPDSSSVYYRAVEGGALQVWRVAVGGGVPEQLTEDASDVVDFALSSDGRSVIYKVGATRAEILAAEAEEYQNGVVLDESVIPGYPLARTFPVNGRMATFRHLNGNVEGASRGTLLSNRPTRTKVYDLERRRVRDATRQETAFLEQRLRDRLEVLLGHLAIEANGARVRIDGAHGITVHSAEGPIHCNAPSCSDLSSARAFGTTTDGGVLYSTSRLGIETLQVWRPNVRSGEPLWQTDRQLSSQDRYGSGACPVVRESLICVTASAAQAPRLEMIDISTQAARVLFDPNPTLTADRLGEVERVIVPDGQGSTAIGYLVLPKHQGLLTRPLPLVIVSYVCRGFLRGGSGDDVPEHVLAAHGFASLCLEDSADAELAVGVSGEALASNELSLRFRMEAVRLLSARGIIDPNRVALAGLSAGASQTLYAISHAPVFAAAIVTTPGYDDPSYSLLYGATDLFRSRPTTAASVAVSPALNAERIGTPLLMLLPDSEYVASMELYTRLRDLGRSVETVVYPDAYHIKNNPVQRLSVYDRSIDWIRFWLKGEERTLPALAQQYARWRHFREHQCIEQIRPTAWYCTQSEALSR